MCVKKAYKRGATSTMRQIHKNCVILRAINGLATDDILFDSRKSIHVL